MHVLEGKAGPGVQNRIFLHEKARLQVCVGLQGVF